MNRHIENNKEKIRENKSGIKENEKRIQETKSEIEKLREEYRFHSESTKAQNERIIHRLITALIVALVLLVLTNGFWFYLWSADNGISITNKDGITNVIGHDGKIGG